MYMFTLYMYMHVHVYVVFIMHIYMYMYMYVQLHIMYKVFCILLLLYIQCVDVHVTAYRGCHGENIILKVLIIILPLVCTHD